MPDIQRVDLIPDVQLRLGELEFENLSLRAQVRILQQRLTELEPEAPAVDEKRNGHAKAKANATAGEP